MVRRNWTGWKACPAPFLWNRNAPHLAAANPQQYLRRRTASVTMGPTLLYSGTRVVVLPPRRERSSLLERKTPKPTAGVRLIHRNA